MQGPSTGDVMIFFVGTAVAAAITWKMLAAIWNHAANQRKTNQLLEDIRDRLPR